VGREHRRRDGAAVRRRGRPVVVTDVDERAVNEVAAGLGDHVAAHAGDLTDSADVAAAVELAVKRFGGLDVAFANAGVFGAIADGAEYPEDVFDRVLAVNVRGTFLLARHALAVMRDGGSLILNSSVVGLTSDPGICAYATSKHALVGLMRTAAKEVAGRGIRVNTLHPGPVDNRFQRSIEGHRDRDGRARGGGGVRDDDPARAPRAPGRDRRRQGDRDRAEEAQATRTCCLTVVRCPRTVYVTTSW
jgi:NAD(P)-dependent dehydrogenase (short-subunit alcohol dehydrogenase family)